MKDRWQLVVCVFDLQSASLSGHKSLNMSRKKSTFQNVLMWWTNSLYHGGWRDFNSSSDWLAITAKILKEYFTQMWLFWFDPRHGELDHLAQAQGPKTTTKRHTATTERHKMTTKTHKTPAKSLRTTTKRLKMTTKTHKTTSKGHDRTTKRHKTAHNMVQKETKRPQRNTKRPLKSNRSAWRSCSYEGGFGGPLYVCAQGPIMILHEIVCDGF